MARQNQFRVIILKSLPEIFGLGVVAVLAGREARMMPKGKRAKARAIIVKLAAKILFLG